MALMDFHWLDVLGERHRELSMPVSFLWGADDPTFPEQRARAMLPQFATVTGFTRVACAKLFFYEEQPSLVAEWVTGLVSHD
jgi:pimeloyl-ACP methyl ester carboxylesterase